MISEFTKMSESFKEMSAAYQQATKRIDTLEKRNNELEEKVELLDKIMECFELKYDLSGGQTGDTLERCFEHINELEGNGERIAALEQRDDSLRSNVEQASRNIELLKVRCDELGRSYEEIKSVSFEARQSSDEQIFPQVNDSGVHYEATASHSSNMVDIRVIEDRLGEIERDLKILQEQLKFSDVVVYEKKVLEVEEIVNVHAEHISNIQLQLQASLTGTHNGAFCDN